MDRQITIALCAFNSTQRLPRAIQALARMNENPANPNCEYLLIDNRSSDNTGPLARELSQKLNLPLRIIREARPGLIEARRRAVQETAAPILSFVDDDNIVEPDWAAQCVRFFSAHPRCGIAGGKIDAVFEDPTSQPPDFQQSYAQALAVRDMGDADRQLIPPADDPPCGAGMTGRTDIFRRVLLEIGCRLSGRKGKALTSGEDTEIGLLIHKLGWEMWYVPPLRMGHLLPPSRLTRDYLDRLIAGGARASAWLDYLRGRNNGHGRLFYLSRWARGEALGAKMRLVGWLKGKAHPQAGRFGFWSARYRNEAAGYLDMALHNPGPRLEKILRSESDKK
jgi:glycosyltransferase involved in cell wall biosynthesis